MRRRIKSVTRGGVCTDSDAFTPSDDLRSTWLPEGIHTMRKSLSLTLTLVMLICAAPLLGACHTTSGFGEDVSDAGHAVTHDANKATP